MATVVVVVVVVVGAAAAAGAGVVVVVVVVIIGGCGGLVGGFGFVSVGIVGGVHVGNCVHPVLSPRI